MIFLKIVGVKYLVRKIFCHLCRAMLTMSFDL